MVGTHKGFTARGEEMDLVDAVAYRKRHGVPRVTPRRRSRTPQLSVVVYMRPHPPNESSSLAGDYSMRWGRGGTVVVVALDDGSRF